MNQAEKIMHDVELLTKIIKLTSSKEKVIRLSKAESKLDVNFANEHLEQFGYIMQNNGLLIRKYTKDDINETIKIYQERITEAQKRIISLTISIQDYQEKIEKLQQKSSSLS